MILSCAFARIGSGIAHWKALGPFARLSKTTCESGSRISRCNRELSTTQTCQRLAQQTCIRPWSQQEIDTLADLRKKNVPPKVISETLGRTVSSVLCKVQTLKGNPRATVSTITKQQWTDEERTRLLHMLSQGHDLRSISETMGRSHASVHHQANRLRGPKSDPQFSTSSWTERETEKLKKMRDEGVPTRVIAQTLGRSMASVDVKTHVLRRNASSRKHLSPDEDSLLQQYRAEGLSIKQIQARMPHKAISTLCRRVHTLSVVPTPLLRRARAWTDSDREELWALRSAGVGTTQISARLGRSLDSVYGALRQYFQDAPKKSEEGGKTSRG